MINDPLLIPVAAFALFAVGTSAHAQAVNQPAPSAPETTDESEGLGNIVVTAQRRSERLQDVPLTVSAINAEIIDRRQVLAVTDLPRIAPGISVGQQSGYSRIFIRGVGSGSVSSGQDPSVSLQVDGVVIARPFAQLSGFFDLERVEVLRGPQGTLYGRNATGGTINIVTRAPTRDFTGYFDATYGNYDHIQLEGALSGPLTSDGNVRARIAFQTINHEGYGRNFTRDEDIYDQNSKAVRASLAIAPTGSVNIAITADYAKENDNNYGFTGFGPYRADRTPTGILLGGTILTDTRNVTEDAPTRNNREFWGLSATVGVDVSSQLRFQTILGYRDSERRNLGDVDTSSAAATGTLLTQEKAKQFSAEAQLLYTGDRLNGVLGLFYFDEHLDAVTELPFTAAGRALGFPAATFRPAGSLDVKAKAAFTQFTYEPVDGLRLTAGLRYSDERRKENGLFTIFNFLPPPNGRNLSIPTNQQDSWNAFTPRFVVDYKPMKDVLVYASATRGFKSGVILIASTNPPVNPEYIWAYEAGVKSTLLNKRLQINASSFYYDFTDLQVNRVINNTVVTENAATATVKGFEVEVKANPVRGVLLNADLTYLDTAYGEYSTQNPARLELGTLDLSGNRLNNAPKWTVSSGAEFDIALGLPGRLSLRGDVKHTSRLFFSEFNEQQISQGAYTMVDASLRYESEDEHWRASLFARNLTDERVAAAIIVAAAATNFTMNGNYLPPRTFGAKLGYRF